MTRKTALLNGKIYPGGSPDCEAILVSGDRVEALGTTPQVKAMAGPDASVVDLGGRRVIPGLVDSHNHVLSGAMLLTGVNCFGMTSIDELKQAVAKKADELGPGGWVAGAGWIESQFREGRMPNRKDLDDAAPRNPVILSRLFGAVAVNSMALAKAGIGKGYVPASGRVDFGESGEPTGILREGASAPLRGAARKERQAAGPGGGRELEETETAVKLALREYLRYGITSVLDPGANPSLMRAYASLWAKGELPVRVTAMPAWHGLSFVPGEEGLPPAVEAGLCPGFGDETFRIGDLKMAVDGGLGSKTALMRDAFRDCTRATVPLRLDINRLGAYVWEANEAGWGVGIHCCGDLAQDLAVSHIAEAVRSGKRLPDRRHCIVHGYFPTEYSLRAMAEHGIAVSAQPSFIYVEGDIYPSAVEESRLAGFKPLRTYLDRGIRMAINTDVASAPYDPFVVLYAAVARRTVKGMDFGRAEALTPREAVDSFCAGGAYLAHRDRECGMLARGKLADLAVLDRDILEGPADDILACKVEATMVGGEFVYVRDRGGFMPEVNRPGRNASPHAREGR